MTRYLRQGKWSTRSLEDGMKGSDNLGCHKDYSPEILKLLRTKTELVSVRKGAKS